LNKNKGHFLVLGTISTLMVSLLLTTGACSSSSEKAVKNTAASTGIVALDSNAASPFQGGLMEPGRAGMRGGSASGTLISKNSNNFTLKTDQGEVKVNVDANTVFQKTVTASSEALEAGLLLSIMGTADKDETFKATSIVIRTGGLEGQIGLQVGMGQGRGQIPGGQAPPTGEFPTGIPYEQNPPNREFSEFGRILPPSGDQANSRLPLDDTGRQGITGTLSAISGNNLTLNVITGEEIKVIVGSDTKIQKTLTCSFSDLQQSQSINVVGDSTNDGALTAVLVIIE